MEFISIAISSVFLIVSSILAILSPAAGVRTFKAQIDRGTNAATASSNGSATNPNYILVELV